MPIASVTSSSGRRAPRRNAMLLAMCHGCVECERTDGLMSVLARPLNTVNDEEFTRSAGRFEPQAELLAKRGENRRAVVRRSRILPDRARHREVEVDGVQALEVRAVEDATADERRTAEMQRRELVERLHAAGVQLHLSEVKGPVMDQLRRSDFLERFGGRVFVSQYEALCALDPLSVARASRRPPLTLP